MTTELAEQICVIDWANLHAARVPALGLLYAIPNGGKRHKKTAMDLKKSGTKKGIPDLQLPAARSVWHGLWIEMKVGRNKPTPEQVEMMASLIAEGHRVEVCYSAERAIEAIYHYLGMTCRCELCLSFLSPHK